MDKGRAIITYTMTKRRSHQGSGELLDLERPYFEARKLIELNGWEEEAEEYYLEDRKDLYERLKPTADEYYDFLISGEEDEEKKLYYQSLLQEYDINGELSARVEYRATHNNEEPSPEELRELLKEREAKDRSYRDTFYEEQVKIALGEDFDKEKLLEATKYLRKMNLYEIALKGLNHAIAREVLRRDEVWGNTIDSLPEFPLYYFD